LNPDKISVNRIFIAIAIPSFSSASNPTSA
jgi:hypothetical protein